jgi:hypothetical protein
MRAEIIGTGWPGTPISEITHEEAPTDDVVPLEQLEHTLEPVKSTYVPAAHAKQFAEVWELED